MLAQTVFFYNNPDQVIPEAARLLIFNDAIQLYDETGKDLLLSFPIKELILKRQDEQVVVFEIPAKVNGRLEMPAGHLLLPELINEAGKRITGGKLKIGRLKWPLFLASIIIVLVSGYYFLVTAIAGFGLQFISPKKEAELGQMIYASMISQHKIDTPVTELVRQFAAPLDLSEQYRIRLTVVNEKEVNAFAIPGGDIIIFKGILKNMQQPEELLALLGHEASHVNERHSLRNILQEMTGAMVMSLVFGDLGSVGGAIAARANMLRSLSYSRSLEEEADEMGMRRMLQIHADPRGMILLMDRLEEAEVKPALPGFLSTHPVTADRKAHAEKFVLEHPFQAKPQPEREASWKALKEALNGNPNW